MLLKFDERTRQAITHTYHCLIGCGIGEVVGMLIASFFGWHRLERVVLAIVLAFLFGYSLTYKGVRRQSASAGEAIKATVATDTVSIVSMEIVDSSMELIIPNALIVTAASPRFWWGLAVSLTIAFILTVPVNRYMMGRNAHAHQHLH